MEQALLKRQIVNAAEAVKKKVQKMRDIEEDNNKTLETVFKPLIIPLNEIASSKIKQTQDIKQSAVKSEKNNLDKERLYANNNENEKVHKKNYQNRNDNDVDDSEDEVENIFFSGNEDSDSTLETSYDPNKTNELNESQVEDVSSWSLSSDVFKDVPFGIRIEKGKPMLGSAPVKIYDKTINVGGCSYDMTPGLHELLIKNVPDLDIISESDKHNYKLLLMLTNAHRRDFDPKKQIKSNKGVKYLQIIKPLFKLQDQSEHSNKVQKGNGLPMLKKMRKNTDYIYWDDPNELVDRLKLLIASRDAGNTGLDNEIISIIEELREGGYLNK